MTSRQAQHVKEAIRSVGARDLLSGSSGLADSAAERAACDETCEPGCPNGCKSGCAASGK